MTGSPERRQELRQTGWTDRTSATLDPRVRLIEVPCGFCAGQGKYMRWPQRDMQRCPRCMGMRSILREARDREGDT